MSISRRLRRLLPLVAALALLPLAGDATNNVNCCTVATSFATSLFGGGNGDEDFFSVPAGSPNLMILLGNSSSMLDFPNPLPFPGSSGTTATWNASTDDDSTALDPLMCSVLTGSTTCTFGAATVSSTTGVVASSTKPYDNGNASATALVNDTPPWGLPAPNGHGSCSARTTDGTGTCLFNPGSYYAYVASSASPYNGKIGSGGLGDATVSWTTDQAKEYTSTASTSACSTTRSVAQVKSATNCATALANKGYYLFRDQSVNGNNKPPAALFAGWFLNLYPPKFVIARKVMKTLAQIDTNAPSATDNVRLGLTILRSKSSGNGNPGNQYSNTDGGLLVVPLGPDCSTYPARTEDVVAVRQAVVNALNSGTTVPFYNPTGSSPIYNQLAETLYNIGQYYTNRTSGSTTDPYSTLFGSRWVSTDSNWLETSAGAVNASWVTEAGRVQRSFCWACQQSSVVIITDGDPKYDNNLPDSGNIALHPNIRPSATSLGDFRNWSNNKISCTGCGTDLGNSAPNLLHLVAGFLASGTADSDLRPDFTGIQNVYTYTISFGVTRAAHPTAYTLLEKTASLGGGTFNDAESDTELEGALFDAANQVIGRSTSFSVSNTTPLQTSQNTQLFLARFKPSQSPAWEGHLYRFRIWNEFAQGCDASKPHASQTLATCVKADGTSTSLNPNLNGDVVGGPGSNAVCTSAFIIDGDCDPVVEDASGNFVKAEFVAGVLGAKTCSDPAACVATPFWDAGQVLSDSTRSAYRSASSTASNRRRIYTVVDSNGDGKLTPADRRIEVSTALETSAAADWANLKAALGLDAASCTKIFEKMGVATLSGWDPTTAAGLNRCAEQVVNFIRGWDVLDEDDDGCGGPGFPTNATSCPGGVDGEERNRANDGRTIGQTFWKLGDIFHSSPALVNPPASELICDLALDTQCVSTLHGPQALSATVQTPLAQYTVTGVGRVDAYEKYRRDQSQRQRLVLVGANDGMLHAFDAGSADTSRTADQLGNYPFTNGTGQEVWAFVPPDLLPKLKNALIGHEYFVDGNTMVRDIWVDGSGSTGTNDGTKQSDEFHTMVVMSERAGGNEYVALDVTNPADPQFRWIYPQPCSLDVSRMGQSWSGFAPRPPPIGPIKLAVTRNGPQDPAGRGFEERWIVMVNGGYDPSLTRGRGIWMMDAWTGASIWRFTNDEFASHVNSAGGMWPVPGGVALLDVGATGQPKVDSDGFFDTATWGDIGGQIFVARFDSPDTRTWAAARAFEEQRQANDSQLISNRSEFYYMTANTIDLATGFLHTYVGSGNRERLLAVGASCGPDNVFGCFQGGCNTDVTTVYDYGSCSYRVKAHANNGVIRQDVSDSTSTACGDTDITCSSVSVDFKVETTCQGWKPSGGSFHASMTCDASGNCPTELKLQKGNGVPATRLTNPLIHNRFYGIWAYGGAGRAFNDWTSASTFDTNRFTDVAYTGCAGPTGSACKVIDATTARVNALGAVTCGTGSTCSAGAYDPGWMYEYGHASSCPLASGCDTADWTDEKTGSGATILAGCVDWNTFRPNGAGTSAATPCGTSSGMSRNYTYLTDYLTGVPTTTCGFTGSSAMVRATQRNTTVPPLDPAAMVVLGTNSEVRFSVTQIEPGSPPQTIQVGTATESNQAMYWLEVPRNLHACRHSDPTRCE